MLERPLLDRLPRGARPDDQVGIRPELEELARVVRPERMTRVDHHKDLAPGAVESALSGFAVAACYGKDFPLTRNLFALLSVSSARSAAADKDYPIDSQELLIESRETIRMVCKLLHRISRRIRLRTGTSLARPGRNAPGRKGKGILMSRLMSRWERDRRVSADFRVPRLASALFTAAVGVLLAASPAAALSIATNPVAFDNGAGVSGTITFLGTATGIPTGGNELAGTVGAGDVSLIFEVFVTSGALDSIGVGVFQPPFTGVNSTGAGDIPNGGIDISGVSGNAGTRIFGFLGDLDSSETSDAFFVSYASLATDGSQQVNFMISPASGASDFTVSVALVPEPSTLLLFGLGAAGLAGAARRRGPPPS